MDFFGTQIWSRSASRLRKKKFHADKDDPNPTHNPPPHHLSLVDSLCVFHLVDGLAGDAG